MKNFKTATVFDFLVIILSLVLAAILFVGYFYGNEGQDKWVVVDCKQGRLRIPLSKEGRYSVKGELGNTWIEIKGGRVRVIDSPCKMKLCVKQGWISRSGESIVCLPNRVAIFLESKKEKMLQVDAVTE